MIKTEIVTFNGKEYIRTWSDLGMMIERDGVLYEEAVDPAEFDRQYAETDEPIDGYTEEATENDYQNALAEMGVQL